MLEFKKFTAGYGKKQVLSEASFACRQGEITVIIGPNGSGKSTLLKAATGLAEVFSGEILADGENLCTLKAGLRAKKTAYLSQGRGVADITVERMVLHGRFPYLSYPRKYSSKDYEIASQAMKRLKIEDLAQKPLKELSGGMRQKAYIAMALCQGADIIMLDEPTTYLDISHQLMLMELLKELACEGKTVVTVLHDIIFALKTADLIVVINEGRVVFNGKAEELLKNNICSEVFGVTIKQIDRDGEKEYYYCQREDEK